MGQPIVGICATNKWLLFFETIFYSIVLYKWYGYYISHVIIIGCWIQNTCIQFVAVVVQFNCDIVARTQSGNHSIILLRKLHKIIILYVHSIYVGTCGMFCIVCCMYYVETWYIINLSVCKAENTAIEKLLWVKTYIRKHLTGN